MNFQPTEAQDLMVSAFARFLDKESSMARVRSATASGIDLDLWRGLAKLGAFAMRVSEDDGGLGLGLFDAVLVAEDFGRTLASGPIIEAIVAARVLSQFKLEIAQDLLARLCAGEVVLSLALQDVSREPLQWIAGGSVADAVIAHDGQSVFLVLPGAAEKTVEPNLASTGLSEINLYTVERTLLSQGPTAIRTFAAAIEEWKLLMASALSGLSRQAIRLASNYASERMAFGQPIGAFQAVSHPLADRLTSIEGSRYFVWKVVRDLADGIRNAGAGINLALWWSIQTAGVSTAQAIHTFGGYGLTQDYDIHLYNLRAKGWPLVLGDPHQVLEEAARRLYLGADAYLPDAGEISIDFDAGRDARAIAAEVDEFFRREITPELRAKAHYSFDGHDAGLHKKLAEANLLFPTWPLGHGGRGASAYALAAATAAWEEHGWTTNFAATTRMVGDIIRRFGSERVKQEVLQPIIAGVYVCSLGFTEPSGGSDVFAAKTRATRDGDSWIISGQKMFTSGADLADCVLLLARTNMEKPKHRGLTMFIVPLKEEGVSIHPVRTFQDERTNITYYSNVRIPDCYRVGEIDGGAKVLAESLELEQGASFANTQRLMLQAAELLCRESRRGGRTLLEDPSVITRLTRVAAHNAITQVLWEYSLWCAVERGENRVASSMAKLFSTENFRTDSAELLDLTAPASLSKRAGPRAFLNQCFRHSQGTTIYGGTSEIHRSMIAERSLNLSRTRT